MISKPVKTLKYLALSSLLIISACSSESPSEVTKNKVDKAKPVNIESVGEFIARAESEMFIVAQNAERAAWVSTNFITMDTDLIAADSSRIMTIKGVELANQSKQFKDITDYDNNRKLNNIRTALVLPAPSDAAKAAELSKLSTELGSMYGKGKYCMK